MAQRGDLKSIAGGLYLMKYMYKKEGVSVTHLDPLLLYMVVGTLTDFKRYCNRRKNDRKA